MFDELLKAIYENLDPDVIFVRTENFDNSNAVRQIPYKGIHCWAILKVDYDKYIEELELWGGNRKNVRIVDTSGYEIRALDYNKAHKYVIGEGEEIPKLEIFNSRKHILRFRKIKRKSLIWYVSDLSSNKKTFQVILQKNSDNVNESIEGIKDSELESIISKHEPNINAVVFIRDMNNAALTHLQARKDAPMGSGSAFMKDLCEWADRKGILLTVQSASKGDFRDNGRRFKVTSSTSRLKNFYKRFGFKENYGKRSYRADLSGNMHREPKKTIKT